MSEHLELINEIDQDCAQAIGILSLIACDGRDRAVSNAAWAAQMMVERAKVNADALHEFARSIAEPKTKKPPRR